MTHLVKDDYDMGVDLWCTPPVYVRRPDLTYAMDECSCPDCLKAVVAFGKTAQKVLEALEANAVR